MKASAEAGEQRAARKGISAEVVDAAVGDVSGFERDLERALARCEGEPEIEERARGHALLVGAIEEVGPDDVELAERTKRSAGERGAKGGLVRGAAGQGVAAPVGDLALVARP